MACTLKVVLDLEGDAESVAKAEAFVAGMPRIFQAVIAERNAQDEQWGGAEHDDKHNPANWEGLIIDHCMRLTEEGIGFKPAPDYRQRLVKIAAVCVAALQAHDRKEG